MSQFKAKQIYKLIGMPLWSEISANGLTGSVIDIDTPMVGKATGGTDTHKGVMVTNTSTSNNRSYLRIKESGEAVSYTSGVNIYEVFGRITNTSGSPADWVLTLYYLDNGSETTINIESTNIDVSSPGQTLVFRYVEVVDFKDWTPTSMVDNFEGIDELLISASTAQAHQHIQETLIPTGSNTVPDLAQTPKDSTDVKLYVNGQKIEYGASKDYTVSGKVITITGNLEYTIDATDEVYAEYEIAA
jgi:hypothetical protein